VKSDEILVFSAPFHFQDKPSFPFLSSTTHFSKKEKWAKLSTRRGA